MKNRVANSMDTGINKINRKDSNDNSNTATVAMTCSCYFFIPWLRYSAIPMALSFVDLKSALQHPVWRLLRTDRFSVVWTGPRSQFGRPLASNAVRLFAFSLVRLLRGLKFSRPSVLVSCPSGSPSSTCCPYSFSHNSFSLVDRGLCSPVAKYTLRIPFLILDGRPRHLYRPSGGGRVAFRPRPVT